MATSHAINYRDAYFKYPELTCIEGEPRAEHLIQLNKELKSNAISVYSNLGGAQHGHLFLVMTPVQYSMISATPFVRPPHPGPLHIEPGTTQHMATTLKEEHKEKLRLFHEVEGAEKALIQQIVKAVRPEYLNALCNRSTNLITGPVYNIIDHLSSTYGRVTAQMFDDKSEELRQMTYDPSQPIDNIFTAVNELADFAELARNNITQRQCVSRAYLILNKSGKLKEAITEWNHKTTANQNWINFKVHFRQAHNEYRETSNMTLEQAEREQNNAQLVQQIMEGGVQNALPPASSTSTDELTEEVANVATQVNHQSQVIPHLIQQMQQMQTLTQQLQQQPPHYHQFPPPFHNQHFHQPPPPPNNPPPNPWNNSGQPTSDQSHGGGMGGRGRGRGRGGRGRGGGGRGQGSRGRGPPNGPKILHYCWSHGGCGHPGTDCNTPSQGHQAHATFANKLGGNTHNCPAEWHCGTNTGQVNHIKLENRLNQPTSIPILSNTIQAKADSGASHHYWRIQDCSTLSNITKNPFGPTVRLPDNTTIKASHQGTVNFNSNQLSSNASNAHILPNLHNSSLISLGQLADDNCIPVLSKNEINIYKNTNNNKHHTNKLNNKVLSGPRNKVDGLWDINVPTTNLHSSKSLNSNHQINAIIWKDKTKHDLATYLHASAGFPTLSTFNKAIKNGNFLTWPGIESLSFNKHLNKSIPTSKGHLDQERKNLQSTTQKTIQIKEEDDNENHFPSPDSPNNKSYQASAKLIEFNTKNTGYSDLTGHFPHKSSRGNQYLLIIYDYDSNAILAEPLKYKTAGEITKAWLQIHTKLSNQGASPSIYIIDNEASNQLKTALKKKQIQYQLVPPHVHRRNAAERAIRTYKNHLLAILAGADPDYPITEWDRFLPQCQITLNLLRNSHVNPKLSAHAYLFGNFNFNATPLAPLGTKVIVHLKPDKRSSYSYHGEEGWYIGPSLEHYRCFKCYFPHTRSVRDADTVEFFPKSIPFPKTTTEDYLIQSAQDIIQLLKSPPKQLPFLQYGDETKNALIKISEIVQNAVAKPKMTPIVPAIETPQVKLSSIPTTRTTKKNVPSLPQAQSSSKKSFPPKQLPKEYTQQSPRVLKPIQTHSTLTYEQALQQLYNQMLKNQRRTWQPPGLPHQQQHFIHSHGTNFRHLAAQHMQAKEFFQTPVVNHVYDETGRKETIDSLLKGKMKSTWSTAISNELGRLAQGIQDRVVPTDTISFIKKAEVPHNKKVTYANFICDYRPLKSEPYRVRLTVGGDKLECKYDAGSPAASLLESKLIINSTISDAHQGARFLSADLKDHFLASPMEETEYMRIHSKYFLDDMREQYDINNLIDADGYVYVKIKKGMYGLKQAAILAYKHLVNILKPYGYFPCPNTTGLWKHKSRRTKFCLCVDDFGVKYFSNEDADHLLNSLWNHYKISVDYAGKHYCGLTMDWDYKNKHVGISMPKYIPAMLKKLQHPHPKKPQHAPHHWSKPVYSKRLQMTPIDTSPPQTTKGICQVQSIIGSILYYARAVDPTMLPALNDISSKQSKATEDTQRQCTMLLDYAATYPNAKIRYHASDMQLQVDSDAAYLVLPQAKSRYAGYFYLGSKHSTQGKLNGSILVPCKSIRSVVASAAEAETGGLFYNDQEAVIIKQSLEALDHPQRQIPIKTDNSTATGFIYDNIRLRKSKTWDMRWNWLWDKSTQTILKYYWEAGKNC
jgi:hypothetical protein